MNVRVKLGGVITLPPDIVEELQLEPGSELAFGPARDGKVVVEKVPQGPTPTQEQIRHHLENVAKAARIGMVKEYADMTTDEYMEYVRGD